MSTKPIAKNGAAGREMGSGGSIDMSVERRFARREGRPASTERREPRPPSFVMLSRLGAPFPRDGTNGSTLAGGSTVFITCVPAAVTLIVSFELGGASSPDGGAGGMNGERESGSAETRSPVPSGGGGSETATHNGYQLAAGRQPLSLIACRRQRRR